jgi:Xaa-Pro aminopeptidase
MADEGLDLVAYGAGPDLQYLTGLALGWRSEPEEADAANVLFVPRSGAPVLALAKGRAACAAETRIADVRVCEDETDPLPLLRGALTELEAKGAAIATELRDASTLLDALRVIKEPEEIERLRAVGELTGKVMEAVVPFLKEGVTQGDVDAELAHQGRRLGAEGVSFSPAGRFLKSGSPPGPNPFTYPMDKGLVPGTSIMFDFGFVLDGYSSDFGRSFYFGPAGEEVRKAYEALHRGVLETVDRMRDGSMRVCDLFPSVERTLDRLGFGDYLRARLSNGVLGHSIGIDVHEYPWIRPDCEDPLRAGMVLALEPKVWHAGEYYLRVEDMVLVGEDRTEFLTAFDRELFVL